MNWYLKVLKEHYADFSGRARRREFWYFTLFNTLFACILFACIFLPLVGVSNISIVCYCLYIIGTFIPSLAVMVRRLHDVSVSGWWLLIGLIPYIGAIALFILSVRDSEQNRNKWGENPKGISANTNNNNRLNPNNATKAETQFTVSEEGKTIYKTDNRKDNNNSNNLKSNFS